MKSTEYIKEFKVISSNKFSSFQTKNLYFGLLYHLLIDRDIFKNNIDIDCFLKTVFEKEYKKYLFRSRPYLASRLLSDLKEQSYQSMLKSVKGINNFLELNYENSTKEESKKKTNSKNVNDIIGWFDNVSQHRRSE